MSSDGKSRLARWADRKTAAKRRRGGAAPEIAGDSAAVPAPPPEEATAERSEPAAPTPAADLPDVESLTEESDFSAFMRDGVPSDLRRLALRKLWASDPAFNIIDEMVEYGEDYTDAATVVAGMKSAWEVGRGYAKSVADTDAADAPAPDDAEGDGDKTDDAVASDDTPTADDGDNDNDEHG